MLLLGNIKDKIVELYVEFNRYNRKWTMQEILIFLGIILVVSGILFLLIKKEKIVVTQAIAVLLVVCYLGFLSSCLIFTRYVAEEYRYNLMPFWSWRKALAGDLYMVREIVLNILIMVPIGFLVPVIVPKHRHPGRIAFGLGFRISLLIELLQFLTYRGMYEVDDVIDNSLGCVIGCLVMLGFQKVIARIRASHTRRIT